MPIRKFIPGSSFDPEAIERMVTAFESARAALNLDDPNDPLVETVAKKDHQFGVARDNRSWRN